jgi:hypothetical protein
MGEAPQAIIHKTPVHATPVLLVNAAGRVRPVKWGFRRRRFSTVL